MAEEGSQVKSTVRSRRNKPNDYPVDTNETTKLMIEKLEHVISLVGPAKEEISQLQTQLANQQETTVKVTRQLQKELDAVKGENATLQQKISTENMKTESRYQKIVNDLERKHAEAIAAFKDVNHDVEKRLQKALKEIKEKDSWREQFESDNKLKTERQQQENIKLSTSLKSLRLEKDGLEKELDEVKSRLSKSMTEKLSDNNPDIHDLSDKNRPTKLAERYQEIYDNQWTDAYEIAEKYYSEQSEKYRVRLLVRLLMGTYKHCQNELTEQDRKLAQTLYRTNETNLTWPVAMKKKIKDIKRFTVCEGIDNITETYLEKVDRTNKHGKFIDQVKDFVHECIAVCWLMVHQDPPVAFHLNEQKGDPFDSNIYKHYTLTGQSIDYVVWPALLHHENGPVLTKGVAQCIKIIDGSKSVKVWSREVVMSAKGIPTGSVRLTGKQTSDDTMTWPQELNASGNPINSTEKAVTISQNYSELKTNKTAVNNAMGKTSANDDLKTKGEQQTGKKTKPNNPQRQGYDQHTDDTLNNQEDPLQPRPKQAQNQPVGNPQQQQQQQPQMQSSAANQSNAFHQSQQNFGFDYLYANQTANLAAAYQPVANQPSANPASANQPYVDQSSMNHTLANQSSVNQSSTNQLSPNQSSSIQLHANQSSETQPSAYVQPSNQQIHTSSTVYTQASPTVSQVVSQQQNAPYYSKGNAYYSQYNTQTRQKTGTTYAYKPTDEDYAWFIRLCQKYGNPEAVIRCMGRRLHDQCMNYYNWCLQNKQTSV